MVTCPWMGAAFKSHICPWFLPLNSLTYHIVNKSLLKSPPLLNSLHYSDGPFPLKLWVKITLPMLHCFWQLFDLSNENVTNTSPDFWVCLNHQLASPSQWHKLQEKYNHWYKHEALGGVNNHPWISKQKKVLPISSSIMCGKKPVIYLPDPSLLASRGSLANT